jgi:hypothetical protein
LELAPVLVFAGHPVTTSDFKDAVVGANAELINDGL